MKNEQVSPAQSPSLTHQRRQHGKLKGSPTSTHSKGPSQSSRPRQPEYCVPAPIGGVQVGVPVSVGKQWSAAVHPSSGFIGSQVVTVPVEVDTATVVTAVVATVVAAVVVEVVVVEVVDVPVPVVVDGPVPELVAKAPVELGVPVPVVGPAVLVVLPLAACAGLVVLDPVPPAPPSPASMLEPCAHPNVAAAISEKNTTPEVEESCMVSF